MRENHDLQSEIYHLRSELQARERLLLELQDTVGPDGEAGRRGRGCMGAGGLRRGGDEGFSGPWETRRVRRLLAADEHRRSC